MSDEANLAVANTPTNEFEDLVPTAKSVLRKVMLNAKDQKLAVSTAQDVLDRAGKGKNNGGIVGAQIVIKDSNVALLTATAREVLEAEGKLIGEQDAQV